MHRFSRLRVFLHTASRRAAVTGAGAAAGVVMLSSSVAETFGSNVLPAPASVGETAYTYHAGKPDAAESVKAALPKPRVLFVLGGPGAGKGTQCARLVADYGFVHLSAGDLLRAERDSGSPDGAMITQFINEGKIVPVEVTVMLIKKAMAASGGSKFLVDGFPRNQDNLDGWFRVMGDTATVDGVLFYECPEAVMEARLLKRGESSGRSDDKADVIKKRFATYVRETMPVVDHFRGEGKVFHIVADRSVDDVYATTRAAIAPIVEAEVVAHTSALLAAIHTGNWPAYAALCAPGMTAYEPEASYALLTGLDFHKFKFDEAAAARAAAPGAPPSSSTMAGVAVHVLSPKSAVVAYDRVVQRPGGAAAKTVAETRVWQVDDGGRWRQVHFHRSAKA